jgi:hypothetical protein
MPGHPSPARMHALPRPAPVMDVYPAESESAVRGPSALASAALPPPASATAALSPSAPAPVIMCSSAVAACDPAAAGAHGAVVSLSSPASASTVVYHARPTAGLAPAAATNSTLLATLGLCFVAFIIRTLQQFKLAAGIRLRVLQHQEQEQQEKEGRQQHIEAAADEQQQPVLQVALGRQSEGRQPLQQLQQACREWWWHRIQRWSGTASPRCAPGARLHMRGLHGALCSGSTAAPTQHRNSIRGAWRHLPRVASQVRCCIHLVPYIAAPVCSSTSAH